MSHWLDFLFPPRVDEAALRDVSPDEFLRLLQPRLTSITQPSTIVLLPFSDALVRSSLHEAKYRGSEHAFALLAEALAEYLRDTDDVGFRKPNIVIVPVPLGKMRRKKRGFNQVEEIAKRATKELGVAADSSLLERTRETKTQVSLDRGAREKNMRGAFRAARQADPSVTYVLFDDVLTTGATMQSAIDALRMAGALNIIPLAIAH